MAELGCQCREDTEGNKFADELSTHDLVTCTNYSGGYISHRQLPGVKEVVCPALGDAVSIQTQLAADAQLQQPRADRGRLKARNKRVIVICNLTTLRIVACQLRAWHDEPLQLPNDLCNREAPAGTDKVLLSQSRLTLKNARKCSTTVVVHVARKPRQNRPIVRKLLPCTMVTRFRRSNFRLAPSLRHYCPDSTHAAVAHQMPAPGIHITTVCYCCPKERLPCQSTTAHHRRAEHISKLPIGVQSADSDFVCGLACQPRSTGAGMVIAVGS